MASDGHTRPFDVRSIRADFPILQRTVKGKPLVYLDNAATTQKPQSVIDALTGYYTGCNANIHRGIHTLADEATAAFEATREAARRFIGAASTDEVVFTRGTTESINLVAAAWGREHLGEGDEIILSTLEHHSNIVPWQMVAEEKGARIRVVPVDEDGAFQYDAFLKLLSGRTRIVSIVHVSNALGVVQPVEDIIRAAHAVGARVLVDGAQSAVHLDIDVQRLDCDFFACSAHKIYGPTGVGILYAKRSILDTMAPYQGGGEMIREVRFTGTTYNDPPYRFEAGTPNIADVVAFRAAIEYVEAIGKPAIRAHEDALLAQASERLRHIPGVRILGDIPGRIGVLSFTVEGVHPQDIGILLDNQGVAVRTGHHCTQPLMHRFGIAGTTRASLAMYNTPEEIDHFATSLEKVVRMLS
jgi:cysteine desulfurase/selenocysteine lyase